MEFLSEKYKKKLLTLAGMLEEAVSAAEKEILYKNSVQRVPFDRALMKQAIENGEEVGLSFQSNNDKYKMPVSKFRIVQPVAMGISKKGELVIRGLHVIGQSEREALATGSRSAEVENEWRLFKVKNIKTMFMTNRYFHGPMPGYNPNDKGMTSIEVSINFSKAKAYQDNLQAQLKDKEKQKTAKPIKPLFKKPNGKPGIGPKINPEPETTES